MAVRSLARSGVNTGNGKYLNFLAGNTAFSPDSDYLIEEVYGTGASNTITFSSIPSTYKYLQIRWVARTTAAATVAEIRMRLNGDTTSAYWHHALVGNGSTVVSSSAASATAYMGLNYVLSANETANAYGAGIVDIADYSSASKNKTIRTLGGYTSGSNDTRLTSGAWTNTSAVSSITLYLASTTNYFTTASRFSLYGSNG